MYWPSGDHSIRSTLSIHENIVTTWRFSISLIRIRFPAADAIYLDLPEAMDAGEKYTNPSDCSMDSENAQELKPAIARTLKKEKELNESFQTCLAGLMNKTQPTTSSNKKYRARIIKTSF